MNKLDQFNESRALYIDSLIRNEYPVIGAYFYYSEHTSSKSPLSFSEFNDLFMRAVTESFNQISLELLGPEMDVLVVREILNVYYDIRFLFNTRGELIKII